MSSHPDRLSLIGMRFDARHGVYPTEKETPQPFEVDLVLYANLADAGSTDDLGAGVDYASMYDLVAAIVTGPSFDLIEALAEAIAGAALAATEASAVTAVEVRVRKPRAPLPGPFETVEAALVRHRRPVEGD
jgi:7,8-dihydroneopterin aldolase/epimerase/oxygenase